ncbi:RNA polymerase sigma factor [Sphingobacterium sp.]|uniref:RNA polymerase sigma factor n=1 Tax=Sphingobacterium sp. TaxID=341027 RepID=UPI0028A93426|nr:sigma-70 family RNA polymerase sigma factor [Sphingobacterium sp.]
MKHLSDFQLFLEIKKNNKTAFCELVNRYSEILFRFIYKRIQIKEDSQDILQEILTKFWLRRNHIEIQNSMYPYLFTLAKNEIIDRISKNQKYQNQLLLLAQHSEHLTEPTSEEFLMAKELDKLIKKEVNNMPPTMRTVFELSRNQKMPIKEIATNLTLSEQTVKNNISLALNRLKLKVK